MKIKFKVVKTGEQFILEGNQSDQCSTLIQHVADQLHIQCEQVKIIANQKIIVPTNTLEQSGISESVLCSVTVAKSKINDVQIKKECNTNIPEIQESLPIQNSITQQDLQEMKSHQDILEAKPITEDEEPLPKTYIKTLVHDKEFQVYSSRTVKETKSESDPENKVLETLILASCSSQEFSSEMDKETTQQALRKIFGSDKLKEILHNRELYRTIYFRKNDRFPKEQMISLRQQLIILSESRTEPSQFFNELQKQHVKQAILTVFGEQEGNEMISNKEQFRLYLVANGKCSFQKVLKNQNRTKEQGQENENENEETVDVRLTEQKWKQQLLQIKEMGIKNPNDEILKLLELFKGDVGMVIDMLLESE